MTVSPIPTARVPGRYRTRILSSALAISTAAALVISSDDAAFATAGKGRRQADRPPAADARTVLVLVNGDSIMASDLDRALIRTHRQMGAEARVAFDYTKLLNKLVNDQLLLQEAEAIGLDKEPEIRERLATALSDRAVRAYVDAEFTPPDSVLESEVRDYFRRYYWRIRFRQISTSTQEEAARLAEQIRDGASMDSLAREVSIDPQRFKGGLHDRVFWADVDLSVRAPIEGLEPGRLSAPFPFRRTAWSIVRVEERFSPEEADYGIRRAALKDYLAGERRKGAWGAFVDAKCREFPVFTDQAVLSRIVSDSSRVFDASFRSEGPDEVLRLDSEHKMSEGELRTMVSHEAMQAGTQPFHTNFESALRKAWEGLVLPRAAERAGYMRDPEVLADFEQDRREILIQSLLNETIAPKIRFNHSEFRAYYDEHTEDFRGPEEVQLGDLILKDRAEADSIARRFREGADFDFVKRRLAGGHATASGEPKWTAVSVFSDAVRSQLANLKVGQTSDPVPVADGWVIWKLLGRKPGSLASLDQVEMQIRQVMFQRKFNALLDEYLQVLKTRSRIQRDEAAILRYFGDEK